MNRLKLLIIPMAVILLSACGQKEPAVDKYAEGKRLFEEGKFKEAQAYYESQIASADPADPEPYFLAGQAAAMGANFEEAEAHLNKALEIGPESFEYHGWLGRIYGARALGSFIDLATYGPKAGKSFQKAYDLNPDDAEVKYYLGVFYANAPASMGGNRAQAETFGNELVETSPVFGHRLLAMVHTLNKNMEGAEAESLAAVEAGPDDPQVYVDLGQFYGSQKDLEGATANYRKALEVDEDFPPALFFLGQTALFGGVDSDEGIQALEKLVAQDRTILTPNLGQAHNTLGTLYERAGETEKAVAAYESAVANGVPAAQKRIDALTAPPAPAVEDAPTTASESAEPASAPVETGSDTPEDGGGEPVETDEEVDAEPSAEADATEVEE